MSVLIGKNAPEVAGPAVLADGTIDPRFSLARAAQDRYAIVFFYPKDFTFVCPSELIALDHRMDAFRERGVTVVGVSVDSENVHQVWRNTPVEHGGVGPLAYPLVSDIKHEICRAYGVEHADGVALRGAFVIDRAGVVRAQVVNDLPVGRDIDELLRIVDALQYHEVHGEVCPAGWRKGKAGMEATPEGVRSFLKQHAARL